MSTTLIPADRLGHTGATMTGTAGPLPASDEPTPVTSEPITIEFRGDQDYCSYDPDWMLDEAADHVTAWITQRLARTKPSTLDEYDTYEWDLLVGALLQHAHALTEIGGPGSDDLAQDFLDAADDIRTRLHDGYCECASNAYEDTVAYVDEVLDSLVDTEGLELVELDGDAIEPYLVFYTDDAADAVPVLCTQGTSFEELRDLHTGRDHDGFRFQVEADRKSATLTFSNRGYGAPATLYIVRDPAIVRVVEEVARLGEHIDEDYLPRQLEGVTYSAEMIEALRSIRTSETLTIPVATYYGVYTETCSTEQIATIVNVLRAKTEFFSFTAEQYATTAVLARSFTGDVTAMLAALVAVDT